MTIEIGDTLPDATFVTMGAEGPEEVKLADISGGRIVIFAVPGAYTPTCSSAHVPSFIRTYDALKAKGIDAIYCVSVNDPFVMKAWGEATGATDAGIVMLSDADAAFTKAIGLEFTAPPVGLISRSRRYSMVVEGGKVTHLNIEAGPGVCELSAGETLLDQL
ncbi:MAG: peroxiredoxin [Rubricella sp.]